MSSVRFCLFELLSAAGTRLAHYHALALIGDGGMGQGWQATDTKLDRDVALNDHQK